MAVIIPDNVIMLAGNDSGMEPDDKYSDEQLCDLAQERIEADRPG